MKVEQYTRKLFSSKAIKYYFYDMVRSIMFNITHYIVILRLKYRFRSNNLGKYYKVEHVNYLFKLGVIHIIYKTRFR